jgi:hypothetical protein
LHQKILQFAGRYRDQKKEVVRSAEVTKKGLGRRAGAERAGVRNAIQRQRALMRKLVWVAMLMSGHFILALTFATSASPIDPGQIEVIDGDTIRIGSETFRLVGFDTP